MRYLTKAMILVSMTLSAAIFGFFYAWVCSTMWGLDAADPRVAIQAMQAMNASVRNFVFAPAFFGTPVALALTAFLLMREDNRRSAMAFGLAGGVYFALGLLLTMRINVPMNEALAMVSVPDDAASARAIWQDYLLGTLAVLEPDTDDHVRCRVSAGGFRRDAAGAETGLRCG
ncbi:anthrone oxygenase family protein [uncultured Roseibium sp.]|uniref:anthrone oxygenase family protein n=1 Tax=uncultured Roseibium sp. TaxID=1936171 RepID=UPI003216D0D3